MVIASLIVNSLLSLHDEILALNETKIDESCSCEVLQIEGYKCARFDHNRTGGGVAFCIRDTFKYIVRKDAPSSRWS